MVKFPAGCPVGICKSSLNILAGEKKEGGKEDANRAGESEIVGDNE